MPFKNFREESKRQFGENVAEGYRITDEQLMLGAVLRIADAVEKSVEDRRKIDSELAFYKKRLPELREQIESLNRKISANEGVKTKMKQRLAEKDELIAELRDQITKLQSK